MKKAGDNPMHRLPDWRVTLPLAQACARCCARTRIGAAGAGRPAASLAAAELGV